MNILDWWGKRKKVNKGYNNKLQQGKGKKKKNTNIRV